MKKIILILLFFTNLTKCADIEYGYTEFDKFLFEKLPEHSQEFLASKIDEYCGKGTKIKFHHIFAAMFFGKTLVFSRLVEIAKSQDFDFNSTDKNFGTLNLLDLAINFGYAHATGKLLPLTKNVNKQKLLQNINQRISECNSNLKLSEIERNMLIAKFRETKSCINC